MEVYRLSLKKFAEPLSGKGAATKGGRWNSPGIEVVYTAANRSLAMAEVLVHFTLATVPSDYVMSTICIPDDVPITKIAPRELSTVWNTVPPPVSTRKIGDNFIAENRFCLLEVPSAVTQGDRNILINPRHPDFKRIKVVQVEKFLFDKRFFR